jgi:hypothetical protein
MAMDRVQQRTKASEAGRRAHFFVPALLIAAVIVAVVSAAIFATSRIPGSPFQNDIGTQVDPLLNPAVVEFRRSEHAEAATQVDPLLNPAVVEFRRSEHAEANGR